MCSVAILYMGVLCSREERTGMGVAAHRRPRQLGPPSAGSTVLVCPPASTTLSLPPGSPQWRTEGREREPTQGPMTSLASTGDMALCRAEERCQAAPGSWSTGERIFLCLAAWGHPQPRAAWRHHVFIP